MFKKLSFRLSFFLVVLLGTIVSIFTGYLVEDRSKQLKDMMLQKGIAAAQTGAKVMSEILDNVVEHDIYSLDELFNDSLVPIPFPDSVLIKYKAEGINDTQIGNIQKYHYKTGLDLLLDTLVVAIQDEFFKDPEVEFAVLCDNQGYTPAHNKVYNFPLTGNYEKDNLNSRSKRIYYDKNAAENDSAAYILEVYHRDTGEEMWKMSSPVFVKGKHWGSFRIGFSMRKTEEAVSSLKKRLILMMSILLLITVVLLNRVTAFMMKPLAYLHKGVERVAKGDLSYQIKISSKDEIGDLANAFNKMTADLNEYIINLKETTAAKERIQSELNVGKEIQRRMLPHVFPAFPHRSEFDIFAIMEPAKEVAGDFYDFFFIDEQHFCFIISDVSGKGVPSALFMVITKTLLQAEAQRNYPLHQVVANVNNALSKNNDTAMFATTFVGILDVNTGDLQIVNAGHNPPIIGNDIDGYNYISVDQNIALGIFDNFKFKRNQIKINKGDKILLYTDGITEAFNEAGEQFSEGRLLEIMNMSKSETSEQLVMNIRQEIKKFVKDAEQSDDITILAVSYYGNKTS
jgi:serine phosphatase RsbU (regulator of sigma subunit)